MTTTSSKPSRIFQYPTPDILHHLHNLIQSDKLHPTVASQTRYLITRHVRITHPDDLPPQPLDTALASRVASLEKQASALSALVEAARAEAIPQLEQTLSERVKELADIPHDAEHPEIPPPSHKLLADDSAAAVRAVNERVEAVKKGAESTRKRAAAVREVLRIISDNVELSNEQTQSIAEEWTATFSDLKRKRSPPGTPEGDKVFCAISPHVTPRSKMRKRALGRVRQPQFGGSPMPR